MAYSPELQAVLNAIDGADTKEKLQAAAGRARELPTEREKDIARWAYQYHLHQHREFVKKW